MNLKISDILISERQRIDLGNIPVLADSISRLGLLQDILVEKLSSGRYQLIDGRRRLAACVSLGWEKITVKVEKDLTELERQEMELEADTKRKDRDWKELCLTYLKLHRLKGYSSPSWSIQKLADLTDNSYGHVQEYLSVGKELENAKDQKDEWQKGLWNCSCLYDTLRYLMLRQENEVVQEISRRNQANRIRLNQEFKPETAISFATISQCDNVDEDKAPVLTEKKIIELFNRYPKQDECRYGLFIDDNAPKHDSLLHREGCAIYWFSDFEAWEYWFEESDGHGIVLPMRFPLIWNLLKGNPHPHTPFMESCKYGLFVARPDYQTPAIFFPAVFTCPMGIIQLVEMSLEAMVSEKRGAKIWTSTTEVAAEIARCYHTPVWEGDPEEVKDHYRLLNRNNVEFINS